MRGGAGARRLLVDPRILGLHVLGRVGKRLLVRLAAGYLIGVTLLSIRPRPLARPVELLLGGLFLRAASLDREDWSATDFTLPAA